MAVKPRTALTLDDPDDLFARPPRSKLRTALVLRDAPQVTITCRVCNARAQQSIHTPALLCPACLIDLEATARHVATVREQINTRLQAALDAWDAAHAAADAATLERFGRVQAARDGSAGFRAKLARTMALGDALSTLLAAWERYQDEGAACERQQQWCDAAARETQAAHER